LNRSRPLSRITVRRLWQQFRDLRPSLKRAKGYWHNEIGLPVLIGERIAEYLGMPTAETGRAQKCSELLLRSPYELRAPATLHVFSSWDQTLLNILGPVPGGTRVCMETFQDYTDASDDPADPDVRKVIDEYFQSDDGTLPLLDFDARR